MSALIWIHEDALRDDHPVRASAGTDARAVFVWDDAYLKAQGYSAKRLVFIAECLSEMTLDIYKGDTQAVLSELADGGDIYCADTPNPDFRDIIEALDINVTSDVPLARIDENADLGRFFRYWKKAGKSVMSHNGIA